MNEQDPTKPAAPCAPSPSMKTSPAGAVARPAPVADQACSQSGPRDRSPADLSFSEDAQTLEDLRAQLDSP